MARNSKSTTGGFALRDDVVYIVVTTFAVAKFGVVAGAPVLAAAVVVSHLYPHWRRRVGARDLAVSALKRLEAEWPCDDTQRRRDSDAIVEAARMFHVDDVDLYRFQRDLLAGGDVRQQAAVIRARLER